MANLESNYYRQNPEVQDILNDTNNLISEVNLFLQQNPTPNQQQNTMSYQNSSMNSNHSLERELNRLNHNLEIEKIEELAELASPYSYYESSFDDYDDYGDY